MGTRVIFLRHGQSTYNARGLYQGCCDDSVLTAIGRRMAQKTGAFLRGIHFDAAYTSPLQRAKETAALVLAARPGPTERARVLPLLREADLPHWEGLPFQTVRDRFPADYACWKQHPQEFFTDIGSGTRHYPARELYSRLQGFWQTVLPCHRHQTILVVAHGGTIRAAIATALGIDPAHYHSIQQSNCALSVLHFPTGEGRSASLENVNLSTHLDRTLPEPTGGGLRLLFAPTGANAPHDLAALLASVPIQFGLSDTNDRSQQFARTLLKSHPETVWLQVQGQEAWKFSDIWQHALQQGQRSEALTTGLVVAPPAAIAPFLGRAIGLRRSAMPCLQLQPSTLSAIHYPTNGHPPMLQALGFGGPIAPRDRELHKTSATFPRDRSLLGTSNPLEGGPGAALPPGVGAWGETRLTPQTGIFATTART